MLAVQAEMSASQAADALLVMAGVTTAGPIAIRRALASLQTANARRPSLLTTSAVEALLLARTRLPARRSEPSE